MRLPSKPNRRTRTSQLIRAVWNSRWLLIVVGIWQQSLSGASYTFGIYSESIKYSLNYDQQTLDLLGFYKDIGSNVGILSGLLYDYVPAWVILLLGAVHGFVGYFLIWLAVSGWISPPLWLMCIFMALATNSQTYFNTAVVVTCVETFPTRRGVVIGLQKSLLGLSGAILTQIYHAFYGQSQSSFILMIAWLPALGAMFAALRVRPIPGPLEEGEEHIFYLFFANALALALYLITVILLQNAGTLTGSVSHLLIFCIMLLLLLIPLGLVVKVEVGRMVSANSESRPLLGDRAVRSSQLPVDSSADIESSSSQKTEQVDIPVSSSKASGEHRGLQDDVVVNTSSRKAQRDNCSYITHLQPPLETSPSIGDNFTFFQAVSQWDFWLLFLSMVCAMGSGLTAIDNLGQIGASLGYERSHIDTFVSLLSIWNFLGRSGSGIISEHYLLTKGMARPVFIVITLAAMSLGHLVIASGIPGCLYLGSTVIGLCYGAQWALMPAITSEIFGLAHLGILFNTIAIGSPLGAYILSVKVAGYFYDIEAEKQHRGLTFRRNLDPMNSGVQGAGSIPRAFGSLLSSEALPCNGPKCFRLSFSIMAGVCLLGCVASTILVLRTQKFYKQEFAKRQIVDKAKAHRIARDD